MKGMSFTVNGDEDISKSSQKNGIERCLFGVNFSKIVHSLFKISIFNEGSEDPLHVIMSRKAFWGLYLFLVV